MNTDTTSDEEVVAAVQQGDSESFGILVERYESKLLRYGQKFLARHEDIQDMVQDIFIRTYQNIKSFDTSQRFSPWIYRIAHNTFVNGLKKQTRNPFVSVDFDTLVSYTVVEDPAAVARDQKEIKEMLDKSLEQLESKYREVLVLYYIEDMSYKEISDILQIPIGTVGIRIKRAKEALRVAYTNINVLYGN